LLKEKIQGMHRHTYFSDLTKKKCESIIILPVIIQTFFFTGDKSEGAKAVLHRLEQLEKSKHDFKKLS